MIISKTPLRMSFVGGGSDLREYYKYGYGAVVSTTIDKFVYVTVNSKFSDKIRVSYSKTEFVDDVAKIEHNLVRESLKLTNIKKNIDIVYMSDLLPTHEGSGLGASSSILVGTLNSLHAHNGRIKPAAILANQACNIEIDVLENPIGKQDQHAAAFGGLNYIQFNSDESVYVVPIVMNPEIRKQLFRNLIVFYMGNKKPTNIILGEQKKKTKDNKHFIDKMVKLTKELKIALQSNDITKFGEILHENWLLKKKLSSQISNDLIDTYYEKARNAGALGGKILGSGGGGFILFYCEENKQDKVRKALSELRELKFNYEPEGSKIIYVH